MLLMEELFLSLGDNNSGGCGAVTVTEALHLLNSYSGTCGASADTCILKLIYLFCGGISLGIWLG